MLKHTLLTGHLQARDFTTSVKTVRRARKPITVQASPTGRGFLPPTVICCSVEERRFMKFHEDKTLWAEVRGRLPRHVAEEQFYAAAATGGARVGNGLVVAEGIWKEFRRPYCQVWPAIVPALENLWLDLEARLVHPPMPSSRQIS